MMLSISVESQKVWYSPLPLNAETKSKNDIDYFCPEHYVKGGGPPQHFLGPIFEFLAYLETTWKNKNFGVG